jgi:hypothetical protein
MEPRDDLKGLTRIDPLTQPFSDKLLARLARINDDL